MKRVLKTSAAVACGLLIGGGVVQLLHAQHLANAGSEKLSEMVDSPASFRAAST